MTSDLRRAGREEGGRLSLIRTSDPDFRVCHTDLDVLVRLQEAAERRGSSTRWSSVEALRRQVAPGPVLLQTYLHQRTFTGDPVIRCVVVFRATSGERAGGVATIDVDPGDLEVLPRIDRDPDVRAALVQVVLLAIDGITTVGKE